MGIFHYTARNRQNQLTSGSIEADSKSSVARILNRRDLTPIKIQEHSESQDLMDEFDQWQALRSLKIDDLILFSRQMYSLTKAGVPMSRAIKSLVESTRNIALTKALKDIYRLLEEGQQLSQAIARHDKIFSQFYISLVNVGEATGSLDQAFLQIATYLEREKETQNRIKSALRYPVMVITAISIAMIVVNIYVIPAFKGVFDKMGADLPWQTSLLISISDFFVAYWPLMLFLFFTASFIAYRFIQTDSGLILKDQYVLKIPTIGSILHRATMERFCRSFALILNSGVPLIQGISIVSSAIGNQYIGSKLERMRIGIEKGDSISRMAINIGLFPPLVIQMIMVGEETGNISEMLQEVASFYEAEIDAELKNLASVIEPLLITIIGIMILIMALGIFLPMWNISGALH